MPELPEVETICRQLEPEIAGRRIERLEVLDPRWSRPAPAVLGRRRERAPDRVARPPRQVPAAAARGRRRLWSCTCG